MSFDIADRLSAILEDILNRKFRIPWTERPADWLPDAGYSSFLSLLQEEFDIQPDEIRDIETLTFEELADEIERILSNS
jgi:predicted phosphoribosyltransferase